MSEVVFKIVERTLFTALEVTNGSGIDCPLKEQCECSRHQLVLFVSPDPSVVTVKVRGIQRSSTLGPAHFDSRLDAINLNNGSQIFVFYGLFDGLRFDFSSVTGSPKVSAHLVSHSDELLNSGNAP